MKKIINGKLYDTDTAKDVGSWSNAGSWRDFNHMEETLHRKRTGEFFLHGEGGPMTKYAESVGQNTWTGGERIIPLSVESARKWAEEHLSVDEYEKIFELPDEGNSDRATICVQLPAAMGAKIRLNAADAGLNLSAYMESILKTVL